MRGALRIHTTTDRLADPVIRLGLNDWNIVFAFADGLVSSLAPTDRQPILDLHANTNCCDFALGDPGGFVGTLDLLDHQFVLVRKLSTVKEVANMVLPGKAFAWPSGSYPWPAVRAAVHPSRI